VRHYRIEAGTLIDEHSFYPVPERMISCEPGKCCKLYGRNNGKPSPPDIEIPLDTIMTSINVLIFASTISSHVCGPVFTDMLKSFVQLPVADGFLHVMLVIS